VSFSSSQRTPSDKAAASVVEDVASSSMIALVLSIEQQELSENHVAALKNGEKLMTK